MTSALTKATVKPFIGKYVYGIKKDGSRVEGKLVRIKGNLLFLAPKTKKGVQTKAFIAPLVLFDLLAIGTAPYYGYGGYGGYGYGGYGGYGGPGFFW